MAPSKKQQQMMDLFARRVELCHEFLNDWLLFNNIMSSYPSPGANKAQLENEFLKIKSKLAREHRVLKETLQSDYSLDPNTMNIVSGATNLEAIYAQSEVAVKKLQNEWHRSFITINECLGMLQDKLRRVQAGEKVIVPELMKTRAAASPATKNLMIVVGLFAVLGLLIGLIYLNPGGVLSMWHDPLFGP